MWIYCYFGSKSVHITQNNVVKCPPATKIRQFLGIIFFPVYHYPNVRSCWGKYGLDHIRQTMTVNRFDKMRSVIHFNDKTRHKPVGHLKLNRLQFDEIRPVV